MSILPILENRFSCKNFDTAPIPKTDMESIINAGRIAPSAKNRQPWRFIVVNDETIRTKIQDAAYGQEHVGQAPAIVAVCTTNVDYTMPNGQAAYPIDIAFASSFMLLESESLGYSTCVVTTYDESEVREILTVPYSMRVVLLLLIGKPVKTLLQQPKKKIDRVLSYNHW